MTDERLFCSGFKIPYLDRCLQFSEWAVVWQAAGIVLGLIGAAFAALKFFNELKNLRKQRDAEASLKRAEFFVSQHWRLFDNVDLASVLSHLDDDNEILSQREFWDKNRKFLTFIEEIELLISSDKLDAEASYYMFGYYAICARDGTNFNIGINSSSEYWRLFHNFCNKAEKYLQENSNGPKKSLKL